MTPASPACRPNLTFSRAAAVMTLDGPPGRPVPQRLGQVRGVALSGGDPRLRGSADHRHGARALGDPAGRLGPFAERFAAAGIAALVFDHRGFGDSGGEPDLFDPPGSSRTGGRRSPSRARCRGSTPSGSPPSAPRWAAATRSPRPPRTRGSRRRSARSPSSTSWRQAHRSSPLVTARMMLAAARGRHLPAIGQPEEAAFINAPGGERGLAPRGRDRRGLALAQPGLLAAGCSAPLPSGPPRAASSTVPGCVCVGEADRVARPGPAIAAARRAPAGRAAHLPGRRPLRHLRRPGARGRRCRRGRVPHAPPPAQAGRRAGQSHSPRGSRD